MVLVIINLASLSIKYYKIINTLFRLFYNRFSNYRTDYPEYVPTAIVATNWQKDKFAGKDLYTNFKIYEGRIQAGSDLMFDDGVKIIRHGMLERGVWFVGEHIALFVALDTSIGVY